MNGCHTRLILGCLAIALGGCSGNKPASPTAPAVDPLAKEIVGKWKLVRAGGKPPADIYIKSQLVEIAADGTWASKIEVQPPQFGSPDKFNAKGTWTLTNGELSLKKSDAVGIRIVGNAPEIDKGKVRIESGRLIIDLDPFMQAKKSDAADCAGEYERDR